MTQTIRNKRRYLSNTTKLSVNINKLATLRNSRGKNNPCLAEWVRRIEGLHADGITVHPRPDERHIKYSDVHELAPLVQGEFNIEGYPDSRWLALVVKVKPDQATLVPDPPGALTSNAGFNVKKSEQLLKKATQKIKRLSPQTRISVFIDPYRFSRSDAVVLHQLKVDRIELYTESYAEAFGHRRVNPVQFKKALQVYRKAAEIARDVGLAVNAGHDLDSENLSAFLKAIPWLAEVSIGHALICDFLQLGASEAMRRYLSRFSSGNRS